MPLLLRVGAVLLSIGLRRKFESFAQALRLQGRRRLKKRQAFMA